MVEFALVSCSGRTDMGIDNLTVSSQDARPAPTMSPVTIARKSALLVPPDAEKVDR
ncbi:hypothetical protein G3I15_09275, partial [Streptomyces sp. SID10244]|nr:hypothetical protein [Streptomyces sp. SID10244]